MNYMEKAFYNEIDYVLEWNYENKISLTRNEKEDIVCDIINNSYIWEILNNYMIDLIDEKVEKRKSNE